MKTALRTCAAWLCAAALCAGTASGQPAALSIDGKWQVWLDSVGATVRHPAGLPAGAVWAGQLRLPGSLQEQGYGDDIGTGTAWTGQIVDNSWYTAPEYAPYRKAGNVKVPFWLNPEKHYVGAAWYRRTVSVPEGWESRPVVLELERTHWVTDLYVDGRAVGRRTSLQTPHRYVLNGLEAGEHEILLRVDNRLHVDVGMNAHSVSDHTQTNWNGVVGRMSLVPKPAAYIGRVRTEPDIRRKAVRVDVRLEGRVPESGATLLLQAYTPQGKPVGKGKSLHVEADVPAGTVVTAYVPLGPDAQLWDEFSPAFYRLSATLQTGGEKDNRTVDFGLREFKAEGTRFTVNGRPVFLRGTLECCVFPLTGYPATDRACWEKIYRACQDHGLNHVRFHSWCPPEAAFHVADSMGMYLQVECGGWTEVGSNRPQDEWFREEAERILAEYGNHPSFCLMAYGNEPSGAMQESYLAGLVARWKAEDPRRVYTSAAGWPYIPEADFWSTMEPRIQVWGAGLGSVINREAPRTDYDFRSIIRHDMPTVSHEVGQWCVYPAKKKAVEMPLVTDTLDERAAAELARGGKVLWLNYGKVPAGQKGDIAVGFSSIFWNTAWTRRQAPHTLGVCCRADHPALAAFPNEGVSDYQWWDLMSRCDALVLDSFPKKFKPIVYLVDDWFTNRKLGLLYEARVGEGRLLVCSADLVHDLENRPAAAQFRQSLLEYMASDRFRPRQRLTLDELRR